jgi:hypothetical protein
MQDFLVTALMFIGLAHLICGRVWFWSRPSPMLKTRIIPCLDVADGRVVKGVNFVDLSTPATRWNRPGL